MDHDELKKRLLATFKTEGEDHLSMIASSLIEIEKQPGDQKNAGRIEEMYRAAHSMKGAARAVSLQEIEHLFQALESCFKRMKDGSLNASANEFDQFHKALRIAEQLMSQDPAEVDDYREITRALNIIAGTEKSDHATAATTEKTRELYNPSDQNRGDKTEIASREHEPEEMDEETPPENESGYQQTEKEEAFEETIRVSTKKINDLFLWSEETLQIRLAHQQEFEQVEDLRNEMRDIRSKWVEFSHEMQRLHQSKDEEAVNPESISPAFFTMHEHIDKQFNVLFEKHKKLQKTSRYVERNTQSILDALTGEFKQILTVPLSELFSGFPLLVRELAKDLGKSVNFEMTGTHLEVDRRIMEKLKDPLIHVLRNSIDHGIELPEMRVAAGKATKGNLIASISMTDARMIRIEIADDGTGLDPDKIQERAMEIGFITPEERDKLTKEDTLQLLFRSGFSTSEIITDISGRGLGMAIVNDHVNQLGGTVMISSEQGQGSKVSIEVPTRFSNARGLLVRTARQEFILPVQGVRETLRILPEQFTSIRNRNTLMYESGNIPVVNLSALLGLEIQNVDKERKQTLIVTESMGGRVGLIVDEIAGEQEILFKSFGFPLKKVPNIAGVCISGTGKILPVLEPGDIVNGGLKGDFGARIVEDKESTEGKRTILIAEDSITSRTFLKNILEGAGFIVKSTVDGKEAWTELKQNKYDLLVTDIEMPRMTGFELTERVKNDPDLKTLPVILVTSLSRREDRERGIDAGADAYIIKSTFDQGNLIEVINRFI